MFWFSRSGPSTRPNAQLQPICSERPHRLPGPENRPCFHGSSGTGLADRWQRRLLEGAARERNGGISRWKSNRVQVDNSMRQDSKMLSLLLPCGGWYWLAEKTTARGVQSNTEQRKRIVSSVWSKGNHAAVSRSGHQDTLLWQKYNPSCSYSRNFSRNPRSGLEATSFCLPSRVSHTMSK